jgi:hypothetical protein
VPLVAVIGMRDGLVTVSTSTGTPGVGLAQVGLLDPTGLPITGVEQVKALAADGGPELFNTLIVEPRSDAG